MDKCSLCKGDGWSIESEPAHDPACNGECYNCPIEVPSQVVCVRCQGSGKENE